MTNPTRTRTDGYTASSSPRASSRALVLLALLGALPANPRRGVGDVGQGGGRSPGFGFRTVLIGLAYLCLLGAVIELRRSTTAGRGRVVRVALMVAGAGWVLVSRGAAGPEHRLRRRREGAVPDRKPSPSVPECWSLASMYSVPGGGQPGGGGFRLFAGVPVCRDFPSFAAAGQPNFPVLTGWGLCWLFWPWRCGRENRIERSRVHLSIRLSLFLSAIAHAGWADSAEHASAGIPGNRAGVIRGNAGGARVTEFRSNPAPPRRVRGERRRLPIRRNPHGSSHIR